MYKRKGRIIHILIVLLVVLYLGTNVMMHSDRFNSTISAYVTRKAQKIFGSTISFGSISMVRPAGISADGVIILTPGGDTVMTLSSATVRMRILPLLNRSIDITGIRLLNPDIRIWRDSLDGAPCYQFILDSISSDRERKKSGMSEIAANSVIIRNGRIKYDVLDQPATDSLFNPSHIGISGLNANISLKTLSADTVSLFIRNFKMEEHSGLEADGLRARIRLGRESVRVDGFRLQTQGSSIIVDDITAGIGLNGTLHQEAPLGIHTREFRVRPSDFSPIVPALRQFNDNISAEISADGSIDSISLKLLRFFTSDKEFSIESRCLAKDILSDSRTFNGLSSEIHLGDSLQQWLQTNLDGSGVQIPEIIGRLGETGVQLHASGSRSHGTAALDMKSANVGDISAIIRSSGGNVNATLRAPSLNIAQLTGNRRFGDTGIEISASGKMEEKEISSSDVAITIPFFDYGEYRFHDITFSAGSANGTYDLAMNVDDPNVELRMNASHMSRLDSTYLEVSLDKLDLAATALSDIDTVSSISGHLSAGFTGHDVDNIRGILTVDTLSYSNSGGNLAFRTAELRIKGLDNGATMTSLRSDLVNSTLVGKYRFSTMLSSVEKVLRPVFPSLYESVVTGRNHTADTGNVFDMYLSVRQNDLPERLFNMPLSIEEPVTVKVSVDDFTGLDEMMVDIPSVSISGNRISDYSLLMNSARDSMTVSMNGNLEAGKFPHSSVYGLFTGNADKLGIILTVNGRNSTDFSSNILSDIRFGPYDRNEDNLRIGIDLKHADLSYNGSEWSISNSEIISDSGRYDIHDLLIMHSSQSVRLDGSIAADTSRTLNVRIDGLDIADVLETIGRDDLNIAGTIDGEIQAMSLLDKPILSGRIRTGSMMLLGTQLDGMNANGRWNAERQLVELGADIESGDTCLSRVSGTYSPRTDSIDIAIRSDRLNMNFLNAFLPKNIIKELHSLATADLNISGTLKGIEMEGDALLEETSVDIVPNKTRYFIPRNILHITPNALEFSDMKTYDDLGGNGIVDLVISHNHLHDFRVNLDLQSDGIEVFNIPDSESSNVHGHICIGGNPRIATVPGHTEISGSCRTTDGTWLKIDLSSINAGNYKFLTIKDAATPMESLNDRLENGAKSMSGTKKMRNRGGAEFVMNLDVEVTDDALIYASMSSIDASIRGYGDMALRYGNRSGVNVSGTYNVSRGNCLLSMQQILRKEFSIMDNSRITFNGDLNNTVLDVHASHIVNSVSMYDLDASASSSSSRVKARCLMNVSGTAGNPQLSFNVDVPQGTAEEKELIATATSTEEQRNMQFMYLLALGKFYTYDYAVIPGNGTSTAMQSFLNSTINGQINNILSQVISSNNISLSGNVDTGLLSGDPTSYINQSFEGILEAHLLNNRLIFNGNFGYQKDNLNETSGFIGDFELKWLLFPKAGISLLGYNRNNQRYFTKTTMNTQGVGITYENDFDSLKCTKRKERKKARKERR